MCFFWAFVRQESYFMYLFGVKEPGFFGALVGRSLSPLWQYSLLICFFNFNCNEKWPDIYPEPYIQLPLFEVETDLHIRSFMSLHTSSFTTFVGLCKGPTNRMGMLFYFKGCMSKTEGCGDEEWVECFHSLILQWWFVVNGWWQKLST